MKTAISTTRKFMYKKTANSLRYGQSIEDSQVHFTLNNNHHQSTRAKPQLKEIKLVIIILK